ncbi:hypothetical protein ACQUW5_00725 [Legionella sp. CNM-1927-20]|uniref:hypothetical protein n=1 Tax=Legionella sp. CNM-1927-20 TaxID=3422221 RepID=UPI00403A946B
MKYLKTIAGVTLLSISACPSAGVWGPTAHSRANCFGFNESITWHANNNYYWRVESHHFPKGASKPAHILNTGTQYTWRAAAYHATEAYSTRGDQWWVNGFHFWYPNGKERLDVMTSVGDCSIYDGWWD